MQEHGQNFRVIASERTPDLLALHHHYPERYPYLLQSVSRGTENARFDILFAFPGDRLWLDSGYTLHLNNRPLNDNNFLQQLDRLWASAADEKRPKVTGLNPVQLPFQGGWFLFLGYELASQVEPRLGKLPTFPDQPVACAVRIPAAIIIDHTARQTFIVQERGDSLDHRKQIENDIANDRPCAFSDGGLPPEIEEAPADEFMQGVARVKQYIRDGDVFQVNLSRPWCAQGPGLPGADQMYWQLRQRNPSPFSGLAQLDEHTCIVSSSPERLIRAKSGKISTRPIAGTFPRARSREEDAHLPAALLSHPKERAEHIMLVDLERNDLGRVCIPGTVGVDELMTVETYEHVHHIVSEVSGRIRPEETPGSIIAAVFPGGTITGCPKVRCMEIIRDLENGPRGAYTGSMGYLNHNGDMDLNILIRTLVHREGKAVFRAGSGLVADSDPGKELAETRAKAKGLLHALGAGNDT